MDQDKLVAAAEKWAAAYDGDDRQHIKTDVLNAYYQGAKFQDEVVRRLKDSYLVTAMRYFPAKTKHEIREEIERIINGNERTQHGPEGPSQGQVQRADANAQVEGRSDTAECGTQQADGPHQA